MIIMKKKPLYLEISEILWQKLDRIVNSGKYASKVEFIRSKIREEPEP
jgi:Arc/MetJ-type ribon-helix-helix transcriptional regulator